MARTDIVFLHAPSVYDFRKRPMFYGPVSDVIPSSPVFEMYPIGFMTISAHLEAAGFRTRIVNLAALMLRDEGFDAERRIASLDADVFAIDLHWLPHAHGATEVASLVKRIHPDSKVEFGGLSASYFWEELIRRPEADLVMRGDMTEGPTVAMMEALQEGRDLSGVPNLVWKDGGGRVHDNGLTHCPDSLDGVDFDYGVVIKNVIRHMDLKGSLPWHGWDRAPLTSVFSVRGCSMGCAECGGSGFANGRVVCRKAPAYRSPERLAEDMDMVQGYLRAPIFIVGDLRQPGPGYAERFLREAKDRGIRNHVVVELFDGAGGDFFSGVDRAFDGGWSVEFSPGSHDEAVRQATGRGYTNEAIGRTVSSAFENGCGRFDMFYMTGLPFQTRESALDSARAAKGLWGLVGRDDGLFIFNAPFAPFVDPGSRAFEDPDRWGYRFFARTLEEHKRLLENPSWKHVLSYETRWMDRDAIAEASYDAAIELASMELEAGRATPEAFELRRGRTEAARSLMRRTDEAMAIPDMEERELRLFEMKREGMELMHSTICDKGSLEWRSAPVWASAPRMLAGLVRQSLR